MPDFLLLITSVSQAAAVLTDRELNTLLGAIAGLWATVVAMGGIIVAFIRRWAQKLEKRVDDFVLGMPARMSAHEKEDDARFNAMELHGERRHGEVLEALQKQANLFTQPITVLQMELDSLKDRVSAIEDTPPAERRRKAR